MKILGICRKASGKALKWRGTAATGPRKSLRPQTKFSSDVDMWKHREQQLQEQTRTRSWTSGYIVSGAVAGDHHLLHRSGVQQLQFYSVSSAAADPEADGQAHEGLLHVLRCEVVDLTKRSQNITERKPPKPFTLVKDEPGELEMTLTRIYGLEDISMSCVLQLVPKEYQRKPEVGEDPEARKKMLQLTISITKGGAFPILRIRAECYRDGFAIHQVDLENEDEEQSVYRPYFSESKRELVNNFQIFLYDRGLNADLATYIEMHLERKRLLKSALLIENMNRFLV